MQCFVGGGGGGEEVLACSQCVCSVVKTTDNIGVGTNRVDALNNRSARPGQGIPAKDAAY